MQPSRCHHCPTLLPPTPLSLRPAFSPFCSIFLVGLIWWSNWFVGNGESRWWCFDFPIWVVGLWWRCEAGWITISQFGVFYFGFCCGWWLRVEKWKRKVVGLWLFFSLSLSLSPWCGLWLWLVGATVEVLLLLVFVVIVLFIYYSNELFILF